MKRFFTFIIAAICGISAFAYDFSAVSNSGHTLYYNITSNTAPYTVEVTYPSYDNSTNYYQGYSKPSGNLVIPETVANNAITYSVTGISDNAFTRCGDITSVTIPNTITSIGKEAFISCGLTTLTIPNSVTSIGISAFSNCSGLTTVTIGTSVESIGISAFANCYLLNTINFNATNCTTVKMGGNEYSANSAFATSIALETVNIGENVTNIPDYAFYNCTRLASITFPNSVTGIGEKAFYSTAISELTIVSSVERIGNNAFEHCTNLTTVNFNATNCTTAGNLVFSLDDAFTTLNIGQNVTRIPSYLFSGCAITSDLTIPNFVTIIGSGAFANCNGLTSVNIGNSVTSIGSSAFKDCTGLSGALTIPNSVTSIGGAAFQNCSGFTSLTLGSSVAEISMNAFAACTGISIIYSLATTPPTLSSFAFVNMDTNIPVIVPCGCVSAYNDAWSGFNNIQQSNDCPSYTITVTSANSSQGTVTGGGTYVVGSVITIEAIANDGFQFSSWNDGNTDNPRQITVTGNATYTASFIPVTAIAENSATRIFIYPNPASSTINITSPETISSIEIENVLGQVVKRMNVNDNNAVCDVEDLPSGVYVANIRTMHGECITEIKLKFMKE